MNSKNWVQLYGGFESQEKKKRMELTPEERAWWKCHQQLCAVLQNRPASSHQCPIEDKGAKKILKGSQHEQQRPWAVWLAWCSCYRWYNRECGYSNKHICTSTCADVTTTICHTCVAANCSSLDGFSLNTSRSFSALINSEDKVRKERRVFN